MLTRGAWCMIMIEHKFFTPRRHTDTWLPVARWVRGLDDGFPTCAVVSHLAQRCCVIVRWEQPDGKKVKLKRHIFG